MDQNQPTKESCSTASAPNRPQENEASHFFYSEKCDGPRRFDLRKVQRTPESRSQHPDMQDHEWVNWLWACLTELGSRIHRSSDHL